MKKLMRYIHYTHLIIAIAVLSACSDDITTPTYTVGEADNAIVLQAGISEGSAGVTTRAVANPDANHSNHIVLSEGTVMRLRVDGDWWKSGASTATDVKQITNATAGDIVTNTDDKHRQLKDYSPQLYWDDYGTADPSNIVSGKGRDKGLTIYGATVNGLTTIPTTLSNNLDNTSAKWTNLAWNVGTPSTGTDPVINQTSGWANYDLLTSNNVVYSSTAEQDNAYKFSEHTSGKLLEFTHAMTKITVNLTAADGFPIFGSDPQFQNEPTVSLLNFYYMGKVDIEGKTSTPTQTDGTSTTTPATTNISTYRDNGATWTKAKTAQFTALVFPGNTFADATEIIKINCDGNIYYVNATKINAAISTTDKTLLQGKNYVFNITVKKTKIEVTATIKDWVDVNSEEVSPEINVTATYGQTVGSSTGLTAFTKNYDFFRSTSIASGYDDDSNSTGINPASTYTYNSSTSTGSWNKVLFWPNHDTHYFFRGVYPTIGTASLGLSSSTNLAISTADSKEFVEVSNVAYTADTWPSDLAIALPRSTGNCSAHSKDVVENGICATKGVITMNFEYAMSKVEVRLKSSDNTSDGEYVNLNNITVEVVGGYNNGRISMSNGLHDTYTDADKGDYTLHETTAASGFQKTTLDAIIPQELSNDVKFKITVSNSDNTKDTYYAQLNKIKDSTNQLITEWKHGEHYIYELMVTKTQIYITATLTDWITVNASENVWF